MVVVVVYLDVRGPDGELVQDDGAIYFLKGLEPTYNYHDYMEKLGYAHLDPDNEWPRRKCPGKDRLVDDQSKSKARRFTASTLSPYHGSLRKRLELSFVQMPVQPEGKEKKQVCQLHRWAYRRSLGNDEQVLFKNSIPDGAQKNVMYCETCGVKICLRC